VVASAGAAASGAGAASSVIAGCSVAGSCFWQPEKNIKVPNTTTTNNTHKEPFFIFFISYPFLFSADVIQQVVFYPRAPQPCTAVTCAESPKTQKRESIRVGCTMATISASAPDAHLNDAWLLK
jgi:hypothetical protein